MIKFKIGPVQYQIAEPTIQEYYKIQDLLIISEVLNNQIQVISILSGATEESVRTLSATELHKIWIEVTNGPLSSKAEGFTPIIELDGVKYGLLDITKLTVGEMADMDTLRNHPHMSGQLHKMMAILWRPLIQESPRKIADYSVEYFEIRSKLFLEKMPIKQVLGSINFFLHTAKTSSDNMMGSLVESLTKPLPTKTKWKIKIPKGWILKLLVLGMKSCTFLPIMIFFVFLRLAKFLLLLPLTIWRFVKTKLKKKN
jgi:hypothetical protein